jgi:predicted nucleic acid-binding protein
MSKPFLLDSSFLLAYFIEEDHLHDKAKKRAEVLVPNECYLLPEVFAEVISVLSVRESSKVAELVGKKLQENFAFYISRENNREAILKEFCLLSPHRFSYVDVALYVMAKNEQFEIITFDEKLRKLCEKKTSNP